MNNIKSSNRIASIDVFRAITMFLMIFVNEFWTVKAVPHWLEHAATHEDMLGFSDLVFPSFLFIMGMSIPLAIGGRLKKNDSKLEILKHIIIRTIALVVMGLFTVNTEYGVSESIGLSQPIFVLIMLFAFFLVWNVYPSDEKKKKLFTTLKIVGVIILAVLVFIFKDAQGESFQKHWWGILGLIGWTYLVCAIVYLFLHHNWKYLLAATFGFVVLCIFESNGWLGIFGGIIPGGGCLHAFTMSGLLLSLLFSKSLTSLTLNKKMLLSASIALVCLLAGWISNSWWIISKNLGTPTWMFYCIGIAILFYLFIYWLTDMKDKAKWFDIIKPAGTATLTCYLIPYLLYAIFGLVGFQLPEFMLVSPIGLLKCALFSLLCIGIVSLLLKVGVKLKV